MRTRGAIGPSPAIAPDRSARVSQALGRAASAALIREAELPGKPGLVGPEGPGAHADMSLATMRASAIALEPYFTRLASLGAERRPPERTRREAGRIGREADAAMMSATGGINTHRGAVWTVGLLVTAAGGLIAAGEEPSAELVARKAGVIASYPDPEGERSGRSLPGSRMRRRYRVGGASGEATVGFPHVMRALGVLEDGGEPIDALLACMTDLDDTCLLHRGGQGALGFVQESAAQILALGTRTPEGRAALHALARAMSERHLSPGGSADMLSAAMFLHGIVPEQSTDPAPSRAQHF